MSIESIKHNLTVQDDRWDTCEHLSIGQKAAVVICEDDSFGPVLRMAYCEDCGKEAEENFNARLEECSSCGKDVPLKDICQWKPYDFHAPSGDEPTMLCDNCWNSDRWVKVRAKDKADMEAEMAHWDDADDGY